MQVLGVMLEVKPYTAGNRVGGGGGGGGGGEDRHALHGTVMSKVKTVMVRVSRFSISE